MEGLFIRYGGRKLQSYKVPKLQSYKVTKYQSVGIIGISSERKCYPLIMRLRGRWDFFGLFSY